MREGQRRLLLRWLSEGYPEEACYRRVGLREREVVRRLDREARFRTEYTQAYTRGAQRRADYEHPYRY